MTRRLLTALVVTGLLAASATAAERVHSEFNFALGPPEGAGWEVHEAPPKPPQLLQTGFVNREIGRSIQVYVLKADPLEELENESFLDGVERGMRKNSSGLRREPTVYEDFAGVPAAKVRFTGSAGEMTIRFLVVMFLADGRRYCLSASAPGEAAEIDAELEATLAAFRFLEPPSIEEHTDTFRIGYRIGYVAVPVILVVALLLVARSRRRRSG
jgi:hypothetical protein